MLDEDEDECVDEVVLWQFMEMGFLENRVIKVFQLNYMLVFQVMEWLIEYVEDLIIDMFFLGQVFLGVEGVIVVVFEVVVGVSIIDEEVRDEFMEIFKKIWRKREFWVDVWVVIFLMEMGFDEKEVIDVFRVNNN